MSNPRITGIDIEELNRHLEVGTDHAGNPIETFTDATGGSPLRCCLADALPGTEVAILAWSPFPWTGAYAETGPIFVHAHGCEGPKSDKLSSDFDARPMVLRPYGTDRKIAYHRVRHVAAGSSLTQELIDLLGEDDVDFVHGRNVTGGCYAFTAE